MKQKENKNFPSNEKMVLNLVQSKQIQCRCEAHIFMKRFYVYQQISMSFLKLVQQSYIYSTRSLFLHKAT